MDQTQTFSRTAAPRVALFAIALLALCGTARAAWAIPTPDVLLGAAQGASSLVGLVAMSGFGLWVRKRLPRTPIASTVAAFAAGVLLMGGVWLAAGWGTAADDGPSVYHRDDTALYIGMDATVEIQSRNPQGLTPTELERLLIRRPANTFFYDVREDGEHHTAAVAGFVEMRGPELREVAFPPGSQVVVSCYSGMRGSQVCRELAARGIDCRFLIGGLQAWRTQGFPMSPIPAHGATLFGTMAPYPNQRTHLSTQDVQALLGQGAVPVDPSSYPGAERDRKAAVFHLPLFSTPTRDVAALFDRLPPGPVFGVCGGRVACAEADALGYAATQAGRRWMGVWASDDPLPPARRAGLWERTTAAVAQEAQSLDAALSWQGLGAGCIGVLAALWGWALRRAARGDAHAVARTKNTMRAARLRWAHDPVHLARIQRSIREHWYQGLPSAATSLLGVGLSIAAASAAAQTAPVLAWGPIPAATLLGMGLFALLVPYCRGRGAWLFAAFATATLVATAFADGTFPLGAGIAAGAAVWCAVLAQAGAWLWRWGTRRTARRRGLCALVDHTLPEPGAKAHNLQTLALAGFRVPPTLLVDPHGHDPRALQRWLARHGAARFAVRSSSTMEDGTERSQAGLYISVLDVPRTGIEEAVAKVARSIEGAGCVMVQPMVDAVFSGVVFTEDPQQGGCVRIEYVAGTNEGVTGGTVAPMVEQRGYLTGRLRAGHAAPFPSPDLAAMAIAWEEHQGRPQDMEWAWDGKGFVFLQARPITRAMGGRKGSVDPGAAREAERSRLARTTRRAQGLAFDSLSETMPRPSRLGLSLWQSAWEPGQAVDQATRLLGLTYLPSTTEDPAYTTAFGWLVRTGTGPTVAAPSPRQAQAALRAAKAWARDVDDVREYRQRLDRWEAIDTDKLPDTALRVFLRDVIGTFLRADHTPSVVASIAASLEADGGTTIVSHTAPRWFATWRAAAAGDAQACRAVAHRSHSDEDPAAPRWSETGIPTPPPEPARHVQPATDHAMDPIALKEDTKHEALRSIALIRRLALALGARADLGERVFACSWQELTAESLPSAAALDQRLASDAAIRTDDPPALTPDALEGVGQDAPHNRDGHAALRVSGAQGFAGTALRVDWNTDEAPPITPGTVVVCTSLPPHRVAQMQGCAGVLVAVGGMLSHAAILAREHGIPMAVDPGAARWRTGDHVKV